MYELAKFIQIAANVLMVLIIIRVVLSWVSPGGVSHPLVLLVYRMTEPLLSPVRSLLPAMGGIDLSPMIVLLGIHIAKRLLFELLAGMANSGL